MCATYRKMVDLFPIHVLYRIWLCLAQTIHILNRIRSVLLLNLIEWVLFLLLHSTAQPVDRTLKIYRENGKIIEIRRKKHNNFRNWNFDFLCVIKMVILFSVNWYYIDLKWITTRNWVNHLLWITHWYASDRKKRKANIDKIKWSRRSMKWKHVDLITMSD